MQKKQSIDKTLVQRCQGWDRWQGSHYELSICYASSSLSKLACLHLFRYVWDDANLLGVVDSPDKFGEPWQNEDDIDTTKGRHYYGCLRLTDNKITGCASTFIHSGDTTWFSLYIPLGLIGQIFSVRYPVTYEENPWTKTVDALFASIGIGVYQLMPFKLAVFGEEASMIPIDRLLANLANDPGLLIPEALFKQRGIAPHGLRSNEGLWWTGGKNGAYQGNA